MPITINRAPVLTLWAAVVAERLGQPHEIALTLGRALAGSAARLKARSIGREETNADRARDTPRLRQVTAPVMLLGKEVRLLPNEDGKLRAADGDTLSICHRRLWSSMTMKQPAISSNASSRLQVAAPPLSTCALLWPRSSNG